MASKKFVDELHLLNFKKHKSLTAKISGRHFIVRGPNGGGKSSIMQAIMRLIGAMPKMPDEVNNLEIKEGPDEGDQAGKAVSSNAFIKTILVNGDDKYTVEERFDSKNKGRIRFKKINEKGGSDELTPALDRIKQIFGNVVDLTPLMDLSGEKQFEYLQKAMALDVSSYKTTRKYKYDDRQLVNREIKTIEAKFLSPEYHIPQADIEEYTEPKDVEIIISEKLDLRALESTTATVIPAAASELFKEKRSQIESLRKEKIILAPLAHKQTTWEADERRFHSLEIQIDSIDKEIERLTQQRANISNQKDQLNFDPEGSKAIKQEVIEAETKNSELDQKIFGIIQEAEHHNLEKEQEIKKAYEHNQKVVFISNYLKEQEHLKNKRDESDKLTAEIKGLDEGLRKALKAFDLSVVYPGLELRYSFSEENEVEHIGLYMHNLPFNKRQLSYGEMLKALIKLSCFLNPEGLNFIWVEDWSLLDEANQTELLAFAEEHENIQFGIEKVDNTKEIILDFIEHK